MCGPGQRTVAEFGGLPSRFITVPVSSGFRSGVAIRYSSRRTQADRKQLDNMADTRLALECVCVCGLIGASAVTVDVAASTQ